jgi:pilus assembly protein Flp/PilA
MPAKFNSLDQFAMKVRARVAHRRIRRWATAGQDLVEYALMAGFVAVSAGALFPPVATSISTIFSKITSLMTAANAQGS